MPKPKILVLTPRFPYPPIGGDRLRIYHLCEQLHKEFDLSLLSLCGTESEMNIPLTDDGVFSHVERIFHPRWRALWGCLSVLLSGTPLQVGYFRNAVFARRLAALAPAHDGILAHLIRTGDYICSYKGPKFLEMTDAISMSYSRTHNLTFRNWFRYFGYLEEARRLEHYERDMIRSFDLSVLVSSVDRDFLRAQNENGRTLVCPNGVDVETLPFDYSPDGRTIVFIGNSTAYHNVDAIDYFVEKVLPRVQAHHPGARFKVIGRIHKKLQSRLERLPGVSVTGAVDSILNAVRGASVGVCPIRFGAGIQNKLLEYMALGIPAITSSIGLEGLRAEPGMHLLVAQAPEDWANQVCDLLDDREHGRRLATAARVLVEQRYSWSGMIAPMRAAISERLAVP